MDGWMGGGEGEGVDVLVYVTAQLAAAECGDCCRHLTVLYFTAGLSCLLH